MWAMAWSCNVLRAGGVACGRVSSQGKKHLVEAGLAERELGDRNTEAGELRKRRRNPLRITDPGHQRGRIGARLHRHAERLGQSPLGIRPLRCVAQADVEDTFSNRGLELIGGAFGDDLAFVDDRDPVGELVSLVEVLGREQHRRPMGDERPDDLPHLVSTPRVESGGWLVEKQQVGHNDDACRDVESAPHTPGERLHLPVGRLSQAERVQQIAGSYLGLPS
jgi:hypothetical protein